MSKAIKAAGHRIDAEFIGRAAKWNEKLAICRKNRS
jgi:hypothetical protein